MNIYSEIIDNTRTPLEARLLVDEVEIMQDNLKSGELAEAKVAEKIRGEILGLIKNDKLQSGLSWENYLKGLKKLVLSLSEMELILAFEPSQAAMDRIVETVRSAVGRPILVNFQLDRSIVGGAVINFQGFHRDLSLGRDLEKWFGEQKF